MFLQQKILPGFSKARATLGPAGRADSIGSQQMWQVAFSPPEGVPRDARFGRLNKAKSTPWIWLAFKKASSEQHGKNSRPR